jgi:hypothetical protein
MTKINELSIILQTLLTTTANELAKKTGFIKRKRKLTGAAFSQALILGGLSKPQATRTEQNQHLSRAGIKMSVQGLEQRFTEAAVRFLRALLQAVLTQVVMSKHRIPLLPHFNGIYLTDCSRFTWGKIGFKLAVRWNLQTGQFEMDMMELKRHDQTSHVIDDAMPHGALHLGDLGFFKLKRFAAWTAAGIYWLSRFKVGTKVFTRDGHPLHLAEWLATGNTEVRLPIIMGIQTPVHCWLIAAPLPQDAKAKRQARLKEEARLDQRPISQQKQALAAFTIYVTNIEGLTFPQAHGLARLRWQIELLFKLWKSHVQVLDSCSADPIRQQCEGYAKLIAAIIQHWVLLVSDWSFLLTRSLDGLRIVRDHAMLLLHAFRQPSLLALFFDLVRDDLAAAPPPPKRRKHPSARQLWALLFP